MNTCHNPSPPKNTWAFNYRQTQYIRTMLSIFQLFVYFRRQTCCLMIIIIYFLPLILLKWLPQTFSWKAGWCTSLLPTLSVYETLHLHVLDYVVFSSNQNNLLLWYVGFLNWWKLQSSSFISSFPQIYHLGNYISQGKMNFCKFSSHKLTARFLSCFLELLKKNSVCLFFSNIWSGLTIVTILYIIFPMTFILYEESVPFDHLHLFYPLSINKTKQNSPLNY